MNTVKAKICKIQIGHLEIEGLMLPDGTFAVAVVQISSLFSLTQNYASQELKRLLGNEFRPHKIATELNNSPRNVLPLKDFEQVSVELSLSGNEPAIEFVRSLYGLSLHQLFCDAFGVRFETEERQAWLKARFQHKKQFHPRLTRWLKKDGCEGKEYGRQVNIFKAVAKLPQYSVDTYSEEELQQLNVAEIRYDTLRDIGMTHYQALEKL